MDHIALIQDKVGSVSAMSDNLVDTFVKEKIFACWWGECMRKFNKREALAQHVQHHVKKSIYCAYQGQCSA